MLPEISVIMSVYSEPIEWIQAAIDSILNQSFQNFEFIIIDDNPYRRENMALLESYQKKDSRIEIIINESNIGLTKSLNKGLSIARGTYIARMDADDISTKDRLKIQYDFLNANSNIDICGANRRILRDGYVKRLKGKVVTSHDAIKCVMIFNSPFTHPTVFFRNKIIKNVFYDESFRRSQDYDLWERLYEKGVRFANIDKVLLLYRVSNNQATSFYNEEVVRNSNTIRNRYIEYLGYHLSDYDKTLIGNAFIKNGKCSSESFIRTNNLLESILLFLQKKNDNDISAYKIYAFRTLLLLLRNVRVDKFACIVALFKSKLMTLSGCLFSLSDIIFHLFDKPMLRVLGWRRINRADYEM